MAEALDFSGEINSIEGCFISMGDIAEFGSQIEGVEVWGYTRFVAALRCVSVPRRYTDLLRRMLIARVVNLGTNPMMNAWFEANTEIQSNYSLNDLLST